ncbi:MAG: OmpH family outer membrane protein [Dysgonamonadaceae bacterium]|jgi:outer membrane protein|nr:OmpH family outer membrane protein [Dysgonamonadaceae bacterium]
MKKLIFFVGLFLTLAASSGYAQKCALIDMEYILKRIPSYESANKQIEDASKQWQSEVDTKTKEAEAMYKKYQAELPTLTGANKTKRENEIVAKENEIKALNNKYFGQDGELFKRRDALIKPIQDDIYNAVKEVSVAEGYKIVVDRASASSVIFASPDIDISDEILAKLGY